MSSKKTFLISIKPQYANQIFDGSKTLELRKKAPKFTQATRFLIYSTKPEAEITGGFVSISTVSAPPQKLWDDFWSEMGISKSSYMKYFDGCDLAHAIVVNSVFRLDWPISLNEMRAKNVSPPQSYSKLKNTFFGAFPHAS
jgi:predicted transcriptional regulator